jgi:hypothetical protein
MSFRPITDVWILARSKVKYFGAYPAGFLSRARDLLAVGNEDQVLHICGGKVRDYPFRGFGPNDVTMDLDRSLRPDIFADAANPLSYELAIAEHPLIQAVLADPPYTRRTRSLNIRSRFFRSAAASESCRSIGRATRRKLARQVAVAAVYVGNGNLGRTFAVFERIA